MKFRNALGFALCLLAIAALATPMTALQMAPEVRGKAELKAGSGSIAVEYGRPSLKGRDMLAMLKVGSTWRMGSGNATTLSTPVDLMFGTAKVAKGEYALVLKRVSEDAFALVIRSQAGTGQHGQTGPQEIASVPLKKQVLPASAEMVTIDLKPASQGGTFVLSWGTTGLAADFTIGN